MGWGINLTRPLYFLPFTTAPGFSSRDPGLRLWRLLVLLPHRRGSVVRRGVMEGGGKAVCVRDDPMTPPLAPAFLRFPILPRKLV